MELLTSLQNLDVDVEASLRRFAGNRELYIKFLYSLLEDENFHEIGKSLEREDWEKLLFSAHTLKGVAGNLGLTSVYKPCSLMVAALREGEPEKAKEIYPALKRAYEEICSVLEAGRGE